MNNKRVLIITGSDNRMYEVLNLTIPSKERYARKHNYDLLVKRDFTYEIKKYGLEGVCNSIGFARALVTFSFIGQYDVVMWIDGDSIITNENMSIDDFINNDDCFYASTDWAYSRDGSFSAGNFIAYNTENFENFFQTFKDLMISKFKNNGLAEQATLNYMSNSTEVSKYMNILPHKYLGGVPKLIESLPIWGDRPPIPCPWDEDCFLAHLTGCGNNDRILLLKNNFTKYL